MAWARTILQRGNLGQREGFAQVNVLVQDADQAFQVDRLGWHERTREGRMGQNALGGNPASGWVERKDVKSPGREVRLAP